MVTGSGSGAGAGSGYGWLRVRVRGGSRARVCGRLRARVPGWLWVWLQASLPAISGIRGFEGFVARISGYSSGIGICLTELLRIIRGKGRI